MSHRRTHVDWGRPRPGMGLPDSYPSVSPSCSSSWVFYKNPGASSQFYKSKMLLSGSFSLLLDNESEDILCETSFD